MSRAKVVIVGGGSYLWGPQLVVDFLMEEGISGAEVVLYDVDAEALGLVHQFGEMAREKIGSSVKVSKAEEREEALRDADYVVLTISTGGLEAMRHDLEIPARYGVVQPVGDTVGPGGLSRTLRNAPVVAGLAKEMERLCPDAWLVNYSNPMTTLTRTVWRTSGIKCVGLCHELQGTYGRLRRALGLGEGAEFESVLGGINHFTWILRLTIDGEDGFSVLRSRLPELGEVSKSLNMRLFELHGILPAAGDRHVCEFLRNALTPESEYGKKYGIKLTTIADREKWREDGWGTSTITGRNNVKKIVEGKRDLEIRKSKETASRIVSALEGGCDGRFNVNMPNRGQIENLPRDAAVETMANVDADGIRPMGIGELPASIAGITAQHVYNQEMSVEAALTGSRKLALQALVNDPLVKELSTAEKMLEELLEANREYLPRFF